MRYTVVVHDEPEPGAVRYWAEVPELPGCFTQADSIDELKANIREAVALYREGEEAKYPEPEGFVLQIEVPA